MLNGLLYSWREKRGLHYNGWLAFIVKRWIRRNKLGFLIPFDFSSEWRNSSNVTLSVRRWGKSTVEEYRWPEYRDSGILDRLRKQGVTSKHALYKVISSEAKRI